VKQVIIIEGPDNLGKSYLAKHLQKELTYMQNATQPRVVHCGPPLGEGKAALTYQLNYLKNVIRAIEVEDGLEIWDRSIIGEDVYGPMYRTGQYDHEKYHTALLEKIKSVKHRVCIIVLYTDGEVYQRLNIEKKGDEEKKYQRRTEAKKIATRFVDVVASLGVKRTLYVNCANYPTFDARNKYITSRVKAWVKMVPYQHTITDSYSHTFFNADQTLWEPKRGFIDGTYTCQDYNAGDCKLGVDHASIAKFAQNHHRPTGPCGAVNNIDFIFVGEAPGQDGCGKLGIPFYDDRSGNLLQVTFDRLCIHPVKYYMTNAVKCCPVENKLSLYVSKQTITNLECVQSLDGELGRIVKQNPKAQIIALGKVAAEQLKRMKFHYKTVYHPAYYLRMGISDEFFRELKMVISD